MEISNTGHPAACCRSTSTAEVEHGSCVQAQLWDMTQHRRVGAVLEVKRMICALKHTMNLHRDICCSRNPQQRVPAVPSLPAGQAPPSALLGSAAPLLLPLRPCEPPLLLTITQSVIYSTIYIYLHLLIIFH